jgi:hypothetical protein
MERKRQIEGRIVNKRQRKNLNKGRSKMGKNT